MKPKNLFQIEVAGRRYNQVLPFLKEDTKGDRDRFFVADQNGCYRAQTCLDSLAEVIIEEEAGPRKVLIKTERDKLLALEEILSLEIPLLLEQEKEEGIKLERLNGLNGIIISDSYRLGGTYEEFEYIEFFLCKYKIKPQNPNLNIIVFPPWMFHPEVYHLQICQTQKF